MKIIYDLPRVKQLWIFVIVIFVKYGIKYVELYGTPAAIYAILFF